jgi:predicted nuclease of predicted toxin-antitoxin system
MKILIDECLPRKLKRELTDHDVTTIPEAGWAGRKNGELLRLMAEVYDVFITVDSNMQYQQMLNDLQVGFIVLSAHNNKLETLLPLMPDVRAALEAIQPGQVVRVTAQPDE